MPPGVSLERSQAMGRPGYWDLQCGLSESGHCERKAEPRSMRQDTSGPLSVSTTSSVSIMRGRASGSKSTGMGTRARADVQSPTLSFRSLLEDAMNTSRVQPCSAQGELSLRGDSLPPVSYFSLLQAQLGDARVEGRVTSCKTAVALRSNVESRSKLPLSTDVKGGFMALLNETTRPLSPVAQRPCPPAGPNKLSQAFAEDESRAADIVSERYSDDSLRPTTSAEGDVPRAESAQRPSPPSVDSGAHCPDKLFEAFSEDESRSSDRDIDDSPGATVSAAVEGCESDVPRVDCAPRPSSPPVDSGAQCPDNLLHASVEDESRSTDKGSDDLLAAAMVERSEGDVPQAECEQRLSLPSNSSVAHCPNQLLQASAEDELRSAATTSERDSDDPIAVVEGSEGDVEVKQRSSLVDDLMFSDENALGDQFPEDGGGPLAARSMDTLSNILETATYPSSPILTRIKEDASLVDVTALPNETSRFRAPDAQRPSSPSFDSGAHCSNHLSQAFAEDELRDSNGSLGATALAGVEECEGDFPPAEYAQRPSSPSVDSGAHCPDNLLQAFAEDESRSADRDSDDLLEATDSAAVDGYEGDMPRAENPVEQRSSLVVDSKFSDDNALGDQFPEEGAAHESRSADTLSDAIDILETAPVLTRVKEDVPQLDVMMADSAFIVDEILDALLFEELLRGLAMDQNYASDMDAVDSPSLLEEEVTVADAVLDVESIQSPTHQPLETEHLSDGETIKEMGDAGSPILEWSCEGGLMVMMDANGGIVAENSCEVQRCYVLDSVFEIYEPFPPNFVDTEEPQNAKKRKDDAHLPSEIKKHKISYQSNTPQRLHPSDLCTKLQCKILRRD